jgi:hypothetical protein
MPEPIYCSALFFWRYKIAALRWSDRQCISFRTILFMSGVQQFKNVKTHWTSQILNFVLHSWHGDICFQNITVLKRLHEQATYLAKIKAKTSKLSNK